MWIDHEEEEKFELLKSKIGEEKVILLKAQERVSARYLDKEAVRLYLKVRIEELKEEE